MSTDVHAEALEAVRPPHVLRAHQKRALDAVDAATAAGRERAWVVLPPGTGKTLVGLEAARRRGDPVVVFCPNTAIQAQWVRGWNAFLPDEDHPAKAGTARSLECHLTALTYQSLATFRPDAEVDEEGGETPPLVKLHPNGQRLVDALQHRDRVTVVLDECHHLLEVWGALLAELLEKLPNAFVLGLTATPSAALTHDQKVLVEGLFGEPVYQASIPAVVRDGELAPFAELVWLTEPTSTETDYLSEQAERFRELLGDLTDPGFGSMSFDHWLDRRFVLATRDGLAWQRLANDAPALADAALRMHHHGLLRLPRGARLREEHRHDPTADDWALLLDDWLRNHVVKTGWPEDDAVVDAVRRTLPSLGYQWTRRGIRKGRSPVDRVLARSEAKTHAAVEIVNTEFAALGDRLRMLVLCDHEYASAILPADLTGVLSPQAGSAQLALESLVENPASREHQPVLVTGRTVGGSPGTLQALIDFIRAEDPDLAASLSVSWPAAQVTAIGGPWGSRQWVHWVTRFFEEGRCRVLIGTRGLLGEGWDARAVTGVVDLTAATSATAVVQTRGRAWRPDPGWPEKVAVTWSVVCVSDQHPKGSNDWERFCRKHQGLLGVDAEGDVVDGVAHIDPGFSPYAPPETDLFDAANARMVVRSQERKRIADLWQVGARYDDTLVHTLRVRGRPPKPDPAPRAVVLRHTGLEVRDERRPLWRVHPTAVLVAMTTLLVTLVGGTSMLPAVVLATVAGVATQTGVAGSRGRAAAQAAAGRPTIEQVAKAVADGLKAAGMSPVGAAAVDIEVDAEGEYRCALREVPPDVSAAFATALDEVVSPMVSPRYVLPRYVLDTPVSLRDGLKAATCTLRPAGEVWHSVPTVLGTHALNAQRFATAWDQWVGGGRALDTGGQEGAGVLLTHRGSDPFDLTTALRVAWR